MDATSLGVFMREPITLIVRIELGNSLANAGRTCQCGHMRHHATVGHWLDKWRTDQLDRLGYSPMEVNKAHRALTRIFDETKIRTIDQLKRRPLLAWLAKYVREQEAKGFAGARKTALNHSSRLASFGEFLKLSEVVDHNPIDGVKMPRARRRKGAAPFTAEDVSKLILAAEHCEATMRQAQQFGPLRSTFYAFLATTGLRYSEAKAQLWSDIDLADATMRVSHDKAKRNDTIPLTRECVAALKLWRPWSRGERLFPQVPSHHSLIDDMQRAGIAGLASGKRGQWHRFRKCAVQVRRQAGANIAVLTKLARHADPAMTIGKYDEAEMSEMRAVAELMPQLNGFLKKSVDIGRDGRFTQPATNMRTNHLPTRCEPAPPCVAHDVAIKVSQISGAGSPRVAKPATSQQVSGMEPGGFEPPASLSLRELIALQQQFLGTVEKWLEGSSHEVARA